MVFHKPLYYGEIAFVIMGVAAILFALVVLADLAWSTWHDRRSGSEPLDTREHHLAAH